MKKVAFVLAFLLALLGLSFILAGSSSATPTCGSTAGVNIERPDNGHHGHWANLSLTRKVEICRVDDKSFTATITDDGTLTTLDSQSPREGVDLVAGMTGTVHGTYSWTFTAENLDITQLKDPSDTTIATGNWLKAVVEASGGTWCEGTGADYTWTYTTCVEQWVDSSSNNDGQDVSAGDITGKPCPVETTPPSIPVTTPSTHTSSPVTHSTSHTSNTHTNSSHAAVVPVNHSVTPATKSNSQLASTGAKTASIATIAFLALIAGVGLIVAGRKRSH